MLEQAAGIYSAMRAGERSPSQLARMEQILRFQALHFRTHYDDDVSATARARVAAVGREALVAEALAYRDQCCGKITELARRHAPSFAMPKLNAPAYGDLLKALETMERDGLSKHFSTWADAFHRASERGQSHILRANVGGQDMWDSFCGFWEKSNEIDAALLQIYCAMAFFMGIWAAEAICALWAIESGISDLAFAIVC